MRAWGKAIRRINEREASMGQIPLVLLHKSINIKSIVKYIVKNVFVTADGYIRIYIYVLERL